MGESDQTHAKDEIELLRQALDAETRRCLEVQKRLDRANTEFEEFVSMAAHNLRESLREVASYSQLTAETYASRLDSDAGAYLNRIREGAARAQLLLADVVDYWATGTGDREFSRTEMEAVLRQTLLSAEKQITEQGAIVTHAPLPAVMGDFETLTKVLHHLIRNAIEYCGKPAPRVHISCRREDPNWMFSVHDRSHQSDSLSLAECRIYRLTHAYDRGNGLRDG